MSYITEMKVKCCPINTIKCFFFKTNVMERIEIHKHLGADISNFRFKKAVIFDVMHVI